MTEINTSEKADSPKRKSAKAVRQTLAAQLPAAVEVLGTRLEVRVTTLKDMDGSFDQYGKLIRIHQTQTVDKARSSLFHEVVHAVWAYTGLNQLMSDEMEEAATHALENAIGHAVDVDKLAARKGGDE